MNSRSVYVAWSAGLVLALSLSPELQSLLQRVPADSLVAPLRRIENQPGAARQSGEAALLLGQLHYARGEYRPAADAFARAAARLDPSLKDEARYWGGLSWLALRQPNSARALLEEVAASTSPRKSLAQLGVALAWEQAERPEQAMQALDAVLSGEPSEAGPAALERVVAIAARLHQPEVARRARDRLLAEYPHSMEAASASAALLIEAGGAETGEAGIDVEIGAFSEEARAKSLSTRAVRAGFADAHVIARGEGASRTYVVRLGRFASEDDAVRAGEQAARGLGVQYRVIK